MRKVFSESMLKNLENAANMAENDALSEEWYESFDRDGNPLDQLSNEDQLRLKNRMLAKIKINIEAIRSSTNKKIPSLITGIAALLLIGFSFFYYRSLSTLENRIIIENKSASIRKEILPDGSEIWLNPSAKIDFMREFNPNSREVNITGEVFFDVVKDVNRPFIIYSGPIVTQVLGTSFRIRSYQDGTTDVAVSHGRVSVRLRNGNEPDVLLLPNQRATYLASLGTLRKDEVIRQSLVEMKFENASLKQIIQALNIKFDVDIKLKNPELGNYTLKADFSNQSLGSILQILEKSLDLSYQIKKHEITLQKKNF